MLLRNWIRKLFETLLIGNLRSRCVRKACPPTVFLCLYCKWLEWSDPTHRYNLPLIPLSHSLSLSLLISRLASLSRTRRSSFGKRSCSRSPPLSVSFDKQICRQCLRITTSFDSQLTVNSQSQGSLHYINGKLDYFPPPSLPKQNYL